MKTVWTETTQRLAAIEECLKGFLGETPAADLSLKQVHVLNALYIQDGLKASHLAKAIGTLATSFTPILDTIQDRGLVERRLDSSDRRVVRVFLTAEGEAFRTDIQFALGRLETAFDPQLLLTE